MLGCQSAPRAAPGFEVNAPAYLYAHTGARNFDEARAILRARIATDSGVQCSGLWRVLARLIGLLSNRDPAGQHRNNDRKTIFLMSSFIASFALFLSTRPANRSHDARLADAGAPIFERTRACSSRQGKAPGTSYPWPHMSQSRTAHDLVHCRP
jgi:hypothetical protein